MKLEDFRYFVRGKCFHGDGTDCNRSNGLGEAVLLGSFGLRAGEDAQDFVCRQAGASGWGGGAAEREQIDVALSWRHSEDSQHAGAGGGYVDRGADGVCDETLNCGSEPDALETAASFNPGSGPLAFNRKKAKCWCRRGLFVNVRTENAVETHPYQEV